MYAFSLIVFAAVTAAQSIPNPPTPSLTIPPTPPPGDITIPPTPPPGDITLPPTPPPGDITLPPTPPPGDITLPPTPPPNEITVPPVPPTPEGTTLPPVTLFPTPEGFTFFPTPEGFTFFPTKDFFPNPNPSPTAYPTREPTTPYPTTSTLRRMTATMTFSSVDFTSLDASGIDALKQNVLNAMSNGLGISRSRITITNVYAGSTVVDSEIITHSELEANEMVTALTTKSSEIFSNEHGFDTGNYGVPDVKTTVETEEETNNEDSKGNKYGGLGLPGVIVTAAGGGAVIMGAVAFLFWKRRQSSDLHQEKIAMTTHSHATEAVPVASSPIPKSPAAVKTPTSVAVPLV
ncbi:hypothetical protein AAMO2058_000853600 [Amorphochlora amoebiformis]